jgi:hypothetical protein
MRVMSLGVMTPARAVTMTPGMLARAGWPVPTSRASPTKTTPSSRLVSGPAAAICASAAGLGHLAARRLRLM